MSLRRNDAYATLLVAAIGVVYGYWIAGNALPGLGSVRMTALAIFVLGAFACGNAAGGVQEYAGKRSAYAMTATLLGTVALVSGLITIVIGTELLLAIFVGSIGLLWLMSTIRHAVRPTAAQPTVSTPAPRELVHH